MRFYESSPTLDKEHEQFEKDIADFKSGVLNPIKFKAFGATHREIAQPATDEAEGFIGTEFGHDCSGMCRVPVQETILETTETEEVILFFEVVNRPLVDRAQSVVE